MLCVECNKWYYLVFLLCKNKVCHATKGQSKLHNFSLRGIIGDTSEVQDP